VLLRSFSALLLYKGAPFGHRHECSVRFAYAAFDGASAASTRVHSVLDSRRGYPPTLREIGAHMGIRSTNGVNDHLRALERKGYLTREDMKSRALRPREADSLPRTKRARGDHELVEIPVLGRVAAGMPVLAEENVLDTVRIDRTLIRGAARSSVWKVSGDSMIDAGILSGDYIFVRKQLTAQRGDIVVALIGDEATVKYYYPERTTYAFSLPMLRWRPFWSELATSSLRCCSVLLSASFDECSRFPSRPDLAILQVRPLAAG